MFVHAQMAVALGYNYTLFVNADGKLFACGQNNFGQLGVGDWEARILPTPVDPHNLTLLHNQDVILVSAGDTHAGCVTSSGVVWMWGRASSGALGPSDPLISSQWLPRVFYTPNRGLGRPAAVMLACGCEFTLVLDTSGGVWSCGFGQNGQLGHGNDLDIYTLTQIHPDHFGGRAMRMIAVGACHSMAVEEDTGVLWTWGCNRSGKLGQDHVLENVSLPIPIDPATFRGNMAKPDVVVSVAAGSNHTMAVTVAGVLWGCGNGLQGQVGSGQRVVLTAFVRVGGEEYFGTGGVRMVTCHQQQTLIVAQDNTLWVCGARDSAALGVARAQRDADVLTPRQLPQPQFGNDAVVVVAAGTLHSAAVTASGELYTWGDGQGPTALGYNNAWGAQWVPRYVTLIALDEPRIGRWHGIQQRSMLAFLMTQHVRLGQNSLWHTFPVELLQEMLEDKFVPRAGTSRGIRNLMGLLEGPLQ